MAGFVKFLKFLRFKLRRKRVSDRVAAVDLAEDSISSANYKQHRNVTGCYCRSEDSMQQRASQSSLQEGIGDLAPSQPP
ncbi:hypothetical protein BUALT_Bualt10G0001100 [Buddleja alternifolia]|uniref:Uncharacterized protein n=1 Tax=Buddleja alternifolia TaxID=168488 RepID=A0AAV6X5R2_9LAMI|nr:hypothetical protein BUALT_Bualt10G0001100 [Buddleja alternifolia]